MSRPFGVSHFPVVIMAILPLIPSEIESVALGVVGDKDPLCLASVAVLDLALKAKAACFLPRLACDSG